MDYINNKELFKEFLSFHATKEAALSEGKEIPVITTKIAQAILQIANKLSNSFNFRDYAYKDEMIGDAIEKCIKKAHLFDPTRSSAPFNYLTQICWNAFVNRINIEQKETSIKAKIIGNTNLSEFLEQVEGEEVGSAFISFVQEEGTYVDYVAEKRKKKDEEKLHPERKVFKHRNLTPYTKKEIVMDKEELKAIDLWEDYE